MPSVVRAQDADDGVAADVVVAGGNRVVDVVLDLDVVRVVRDPRSAIRRWRTPLPRCGKSSL